MNRSDTRRRKPDIVVRDIAGETVLVPIRGTVADLQKIYTTNAVGACIWNLLDGKHSLGEISDILLERFDAPPEQVEEDLEEFLGQVGGMGLLE